jgi:hypothetical protein
MKSPQSKAKTVNVKPRKANFMSKLKERLKAMDKTTQRDLCLITAGLMMMGGLPTVAGMFLIISTFI